MGGAKIEPKSPPTRHKNSPVPPPSPLVIHISKQSALPSMNVAGEGLLRASLCYNALHCTALLLHCYFYNAQHHITVLHCPAL